MKGPTVMSPTCHSCPTRTQHVYCDECAVKAQNGLGRARAVLGKERPAPPPPPTPDPIIDPIHERRANEANEIDESDPGPDDPGDDGDYHDAGYWDGVDDDKIGDPWAGGRGRPSGRSLHR